MRTRFQRQHNPINPATLRLLQELETLRFGYALGGAFRQRRTLR